jgi:hypothetical protein
LAYNIACGSHQSTAMTAEKEGAAQDESVETLNNSDIDTDFVLDSSLVIGE